MLRRQPPRSTRSTARNRQLAARFVVLVAFFIASVIIYSLARAATRSGPSPSSRRTTAAGRGSSERTVAGIKGYSSDHVVCGPDDASTDLGFDYPQLRKLRGLVKQWCTQHQQQLSWQQLTAAYLTALAHAAPAHSTAHHAASTSGSNGAPHVTTGVGNNGGGAASDAGVTAAAALLAKLLQEAVSFLAAHAPGAVLHCRSDPSLLKAWRESHGLADSSSSDSSGSSIRSSHSSRKYLLAANFHNSAGVLPNFLVQVLRLVLLVPRGNVAVSVYESGSSDTSRLWLHLLHHLLLPLGVPHNITLSGSLSPRSGLQRIQLMAALRNAPLEPWLPPLPPQQQQQHELSLHQQQVLLQQQQLKKQQKQRAPRKAGAAKAAAKAAGAAVAAQHLDLSFRGRRFAAGAAGWSPDVILYSNDVLLCAEDVLRLASHDAHVACGMDFYDAPWMAAPAAAAAADAAARAADAAAAAGGGEEGVGDGGVAEHSSGGGDYTTHTDGSSTTNSNTSSSGSSGDSSAGATLPGLGGAEDDFFDPLRGQVTPATHADGRDSSSNKSVPAGLRFYDKWVARDASGHRLVNRAPFITHHTPSQAALSVGQPVPMSCCWNGLAVLTAKPFLQGLRFRISQPGECQGSECSLMCEDFARLGFRHVVMDPGVRLGYELEQVDLLQGAGTTAAAAAAGAIVGPAAVAGGSTGAAAATAEAGAVVVVQQPSATAAAAVPLQGLGPWLPWSTVSATSAALAAAAAAAQAQCARQQSMLVGAPGGSAAAAAANTPATTTTSSSSSTSSRSSSSSSNQPGAGSVTPCVGSPAQVECCDLPPGRSYVDFMRACHMVQLYATNFTAQALAVVA